MSTLGKIFIVLAIIGSLASAAGGFLLATKKSGYATQLAQVEDALRATDSAIRYAGDFKVNPAEPAASVQKANAAFTKTSEELEETRSSLTDAESKLSTAQAEVAQLTTELTAAKNSLEEKTTALTDAESKLQETSQELAKTKDLLGGRDLEVVLAESRDTKEKLEILETEKKLIEDTLLQKQARIDEFERLDRLRDAKAAPLELSGKVVALNKSWNFVVLDVGQQNQLVEGVDLTVYRGDALVGKVRTVSVDQDTAIADILPEWSQAEIQVGDQVIF